MEQLKIADELHIPFSDTSKMSLLDRKYAILYINQKYEALEKSLNDKK